MHRYWILVCLFILIVPLPGIAAPVVIVIGNKGDSYYQRFFSKFAPQLEEKVSLSLPGAKFVEIDTQDFSGLRRKISQNVDPGDVINGVVIYAYGRTKTISLSPERRYMPEELSETLGEALSVRSLAERFTVYFAANWIGKPSEDNSFFMEEFTLSFNKYMTKTTELNVIGHPARFHRKALKPLNQFQEAIISYSYSPKVNTISGRTSTILVLFSIAGVAYEIRSGHFFDVALSSLDFAVLALMSSAVGARLLDDTYGRGVRQLTINSDSARFETYGICSNTLAGVFRQPKN